MSICSGWVVEDESEKAVLRAIETMRVNLGDQLTVDDLARSAIFSKFYFSRVFHRITGVSPGRFLSALRIQEAKRLLESTPLTVTEVSAQIGYSSVGTFSSRFKTSVGVPPIGYRRSARVLPPLCPGTEDPGIWSPAIRGDIDASLIDSPVFVGLFPDRILEGMPVRCVLLLRPGPFVLANVPAGRWHLLAVTLDAHPPGSPGVEMRCVAHHGPIEADPGAGGGVLYVRLRPSSILDPPVLLALPDLESLPPGVLSPETEGG